MTRRREHFFNENYFHSIETPEQAYWLGFITADGCISRWAVTIGLKRQDANHLRKFANCIESEIPVKPTIKRCGERVYHGARISVCSKRMIESLARLGVTPRKSLTIEPWSGPSELMPAYWRGLFDGDGGIGKVYRKASGKTTWSIYIVGTYACVDGFSQWAREICGSTAQLSKLPSIWQWQTGGTISPQLLARELKAIPIWLDRKQDLLEELCSIDFGSKYLRAKTRGRGVMPYDDADAIV